MTCWKSRSTSGSSYSFFAAIGIATVAILIRCCFRVAELSGGFRGSLANDQVSFMILEGAMVVIAVSCLTVAHLGLVMGPVWQAAAFRFRAKKFTSFNEG
ncbi:phospholipid-translocating ATPase rsb1 [Elasticomyces elasticus]|nr:phospholipid-translocating ATPase rsb1 [Elasticomyces elasticus]